LEHPAIVPIYGLGKDSNGRPFYAMRFVRGESLSESIRHVHQHRKSNSNEPSRVTLHASPGTANVVHCNGLLRQLIQVCNAVAFAHSRGIIHCDLKPDNIMIGAFGEVYVIDWGLARRFQHKAILQCNGKTVRSLVPSEESSASAENGSVIGTPQFISPEQAAGHVDQLGPASDVYSLGATLYCILTAKPPFPDPREIGIQDLISRISEGHFPMPSVVLPGIHKPLEDICLKAMALHRENRYESASAMAQDIESYLDHLPVFASADLRRIHQRGLAMVTVSLQESIVFEAFLSRPTLLGRQRSQHDTMYRPSDDKGHTRLSIAPIEDNSVSAMHAMLEPLECGRVRLVNLSTRLSIKMDGGHELLTGGAAQLALPVKFSLGETLIQLKWTEGRSERNAATLIEDTSQTKVVKPERTRPQIARPSSSRRQRLSPRVFLVLALIGSALFFAVFLVCSFAYPSLQP